MKYAGLVKIAATVVRRKQASSTAELAPDGSRRRWQSVPAGDQAQVKRLLSEGYIRSGVKLVHKPGDSEATVSPRAVTTLSKAQQDRFWLMLHKAHMKFPEYRESLKLAPDSNVGNSEDRKPAEWAAITNGRGLEGGINFRKDKDGLVIPGLYVSPGSRGKGIATELVNHVLARAGKQPVSVSAAASNDIARQLYESRGFTPMTDFMMLPQSKQAQEFAPGIMDKAVYGDVLGTLKPGDITDFVLQRHDTVRNPKNPHYDLRLGTKDTNLFSWAVPGATMPGPGEMKRPLPQTQLHTYQYGSFQGKIPHGYGAGTVKMQDKGQAIITKVSPNTLHFTLGHKKVPMRYVLIHTGGKDGKMWQLYGMPEGGNIPGIGDKPVYKKIEAADQDEAIAQAQQLQEKIDGAHGIVDVNDKGDVGVYSVRPSAAGHPITHSERMGVFGVRIPKFRKSTYRGELYYTDAKGKAIPFKDVSGLLNMVPAKSMQSQRDRGLTPRVALFDAIRSHGHDVAGLPVQERQQLVQEILQALPEDRFHAPATATTVSEKRKLFRTIQQGKNPRTSEGVMATTPEGKVVKIKNKEEAMGTLTGTYPGTGKRRDSAGGLTFTLNKDGPEGRVGTGFTDADLADIVSRLGELKGQPIRLEHMGRFGSGKLRAPSFKGFEVDKAAAFLKLGQMVPRVLATAAEAMGPISNYGSATTLAGMPQAGTHTGVSGIQAVADNGFAITDLGGVGTKSLARVMPHYLPHAANQLSRFGGAADRVAAPLWAASTLVDGARAIANPAAATERFHEGQAEIPGRPLLTGLKRDAAALAAPMTSMGVLSNEIGALGKATWDMGKAQRSSAQTQQAVNARLAKARASRTAPAVPPAMVGTNTPTMVKTNAEKQAKIKRRGKNFTVFNRKGKVLGFHRSRAAAERQERGSRKYAEARLQFKGSDGQVKAAALVMIADTPGLRELGLSGRKALDQGTGMFFDKAGTYWMKDVGFPLDIVFTDAKGKILHKEAMAVEKNPARPRALYSGPLGTEHAVELPGGWCEAHGIGIGDTVWPG